MVILEQDPADSAAFRMFIACSANRLTECLSERGRLIIGAAEPLSHQRWFVSALDFDNGEPINFDPSFNILDGVQCESSADARGGWDGSGESQTVEAVVHAQLEIALNFDGFVDELGEQRNGQETVSDGGPVRRFAARAVLIEMNPLVVAGDLGEPIDLRLRDDVPVADANFLADAAS